MEKVYIAAVQSLSAGRHWTWSNDGIFLDQFQAIVLENTGVPATGSSDQDFFLLCSYLIIVRCGSLNKVAVSSMFRYRSKCVKPFNQMSGFCFVMTCSVMGLIWCFGANWCFDGNWMLFRWMMKILKGEKCIMYEGYKNFVQSEFYKWWGRDVSCHKPVCVECLKWGYLYWLCLQAILATQQRIQQLVPGFRFNLGFSGKYFHHGTSDENLGDDMLLGKCPVCAVITAVVMW
jgi:hypothetical protein